MTTGCLRIGAVCVAVAGLWSGVLRPHQFDPPSPVALQARVLQSNPMDLTPSVLHIKSRGTITFLMHHSAASHFLYRGAQMGFEYELAKAFATELGVELEVLTPPPGVELATWLREGRGDIAAGLATTDDLNLEPLQVSAPYLETTAQVLTQKEEQTLRNIDGLAGKIVSIQPSLFDANQLLAPSHGLLTPPVLITAQSKNALGEAVTAVVRKKAAAMVMTAPLAGLAHTLYPGKLRTAWTLPGTIRLVWAVRPERADLLATINAYLERANRSGFKNILFRKYFVTANHLRDIAQAPSTLVSKRLSRYDRLIAHHAEKAGFDWRLVAALIFEESRFDHNRVSKVGAYGLMQVMPTTAEWIGIKDYTDLHGNIRAGMKYLRFLANQFPNGRPVDRLAFVLASYLLGPGRVQEAQQLARTLGYDPDRWVGSMSRVLPLLENPRYYRRTRSGFAPGTQAVKYTNTILKRYFLYSRHVSRKLSPAKVQPPAPPQAASAVG